MTWTDGLRILVLVGLFSGAWRAWKALPPPLRHEGRRYYRQPDGSYCNAWGLRVKDEAILSDLRSTEAGATGGGGRTAT